MDNPQRSQLDECEPSEDELTPELESRPLVDHSSTKHNSKLEELLLTILQIHVGSTDYELAQKKDSSLATARDSLSHLEDKGRPDRSNDHWFKGPAPEISHKLFINQHRF